jgi:hypothetical protein
MKPETLLNQWLSLLAASANPASALAMSMGLAAFKPEMLRRTETPKELVEPTERAAAPEPKKALRAPSAQGWLGRIFDRLETWSWEREVRAREAYLAQSQDLFDLEARMRHLDGDVLSRGRALR